MVSFQQEKRDKRHISAPGPPLTAQGERRASEQQIGWGVGGWGLFVYLTDLPSVAQSQSKRLVSVSEELPVAMVTGQQSVEV